MPSSKGFCKVGYEPVRALFDYHVQNGENLQTCAYVNGEKVLDLYSLDHNSTYSITSVQNVFSSTKAITSLVVAMLEDQGHLRYDQKVSEIWHEFGQHGKNDMTVAQVMRHEAGLPRLKITALNLTRERIKQGAVSHKIEIATPKFPNGARDVADRSDDPNNDKRWREYHAESRGWIINEIVRRADPKKRTVGEIIRDDICTTLDIDRLELFLGAEDDAQLENIHPMSSIDHLAWATWRSIILPFAFLGGATIPLKSGWLRFWLLLGIPMFKPPYELYQLFRSMFKLPPTQPGGDLLGGVVVSEETLREMDDVTKMHELRHNHYNTKEVRQCEIPSANGHANARSLAAIANTLAQGGVAANGARLLSKEGVARAQGNAVRNSMGSAGRLTNADFSKYNRFTNAGWNCFDETPRRTGRDGWVGWLGIGGSILQWYNSVVPEKNQKKNQKNDEQQLGIDIGFGFCGTEMHLIPTNERAASLQEMLKHCAERAIGGRDGGSVGSRSRL